MTKFKPVFAALHITTYCEGNCAFCYITEEGAPRQHGDLQTLKRIVDQLAIAGVETIELVGGNPSLYPDIVELLEYCNQAGLEVAILSNTQYYPHTSIAEIAPYVTALETTIHGLPEVHDHFTRTGAYAETMARLREWQQCKTPEQGTGITLNFTKVNYAHIFETITHVLHWGIKVDYVQVQRIGPHGRATDGSWKLTLDEIMTAYRQIARLSEELGIRAEVVDAFPLCLLPEEVRQYAGRCDWGFGTCAVFMDGSVSRCAVARRDLGNILETPLIEIWNSHPELEEFRAKTYLRDECQRCPLLEPCGGGALPAVADATSVQTNSSVATPTGAKSETSNHEVQASSEKGKFCQKSGYFYRPLFLVVTKTLTIL